MDEREQPRQEEDENSHGARIVKKVIFVTAASAFLYISFFLLQKALNSQSPLPVLAELPKGILSAKLMGGRSSPNTIRVIVFSTPGGIHPALEQKITSLAGSIQHDHIALLWLVPQEEVSPPLGGGILEIIAMQEQDATRMKDSIDNLLLSQLDFPYDAILVDSDSRIRTAYDTTSRFFNEHALMTIGKLVRDEEKSGESFSP